jgi:NAD(P)H-hydrate epimerase
MENSPKLWSLPKLRPDGHKYDRGHLLVLGGGTMTGAARLSALAAQRSGTGLVTLAAPREAWPTYAASLLSAIARPLDGIADWKKLLGVKTVSAVLIGPGADAGPLTAGAIRAATAEKQPLVLDATALTMLGDSADLRRVLPAGTILTPHAGEYEKLAKAYRIPAKLPVHEGAKNLAKTSRCVVVLKGAETIIAAPDGRAVLNHARAPWLATAGTGDVLAGIIAGLLAQGMEPLPAACAGVWLHSEAARTLGPGMIADDLPGALPSVLRKLMA